MISEDLKAIIDADIALCEDIKNGTGSVDLYEIYSRLLSKYANIISGFSENMRSVYYDDGNRNKKANIETMKQKLLLFKAMGYSNMPQEQASGNSTNINVNSQNVNTNTVSITLTFDETREKIEKMSALKDEEIDEILEKIDELEAIINSNDRKSRKWENATGIIKWIADKAADVGMVLLPLLLKINE